MTKSNSTKSVVIEAEDRSVIANNYEKEIRKYKENIGRNIWDLASALKQIRDSEYYIELGYENIKEWLSSPEIDIAERTAYAFIELHETYILQHKIDVKELIGTDYSKLYRVLPIIRKHPEQVDEWVDKAKNLRRSDLQREIREFRIDNKKILADNITKNTAEVKNLIKGNAYEEISKLAENSIDLVITKPPILSPNHIVDTQKEFKDLNLSPYLLQSMYHIKWLKELFNKLTSNASLFLVGNYNTIFLLAHAAQSAGYFLIRDIVWLHSPAKTVNINQLVEGHETVLWLRKGATYVNNYNNYEKDVWDFDFKPQYDHPSDMPERVVREMIDLGSYTKQTVLDPFAGAGTVPFVAKSMKRSFIAIESDPLWYAIINQRLSEDNK